jgi:hypothetical protein
MQDPRHRRWLGIVYGFRGKCRTRTGAAPHEKKRQRVVAAAVRGVQALAAAQVGLGTYQEPLTLTSGVVTRVPYTTVRLKRTVP